MIPVKRPRCPIGCAALPLLGGLYGRSGWGGPTGTFKSATPRHAHRAFRAFRASAVQDAVSAPRPGAHFGPSEPRAAHLAASAPGPAAHFAASLPRAAHIGGSQPRPPRISRVSRNGPLSTRFPRHARRGSGGMNGFRAAGRPGTAQFGGSRPAGRSYRPI